MSNVYTTVTPVLSSAVGYVSDVRDQVASLMRYVLVNPGFTSSLWENHLVSFRVISSKYDHEPDELIRRLRLAFTGVFRRMFPDYSFENNFTHSPYLEDNAGNVIQTESDTTDPFVRYNVNFDIVIKPTSISTTDIMEEGMMAIVSGVFVVDPTTNIITVNFNNTPDNQFLE